MVGIPNLLDSMLTIEIAAKIQQDAVASGTPRPNIQTLKPHLNFKSLHVAISGNKKRDVNLTSLVFALQRGLSIPFCKLWQPKNSLSVALNVEK
jgi:hypothetical protein